MLVTPDGQRRPAGFKTGTTNDFRDVSGFGYVPGSLTTGVWMGNNNQEPMSNEFSGGLFSADGPLFLWQDFMELALNQPWAWNDNHPVGQTSFPQPDGIVNANVCRWSGMAAHEQLWRPTVTLPFLEGTVPPFDNVHPSGCLDLELYVSHAVPTRPPNWIDGGRHLVGPGGERPDRRERGSRSATRRIRTSSSRSRRSTASPASRPCAASASPSPVRPPATW